MIFDTSIRKEFTQSASGISVALIAILLSTQLIRFLKEAVSGNISPEAVLVLLGFATLQFLPIVLTLTLFVSVLLCLSRVHRDSEMLIWLSAGQSALKWIKPVLKFALPFIVVIATLSLVISPWASRMADTYRLQLTVKSELSQITPGNFREVNGGQRVFFIENNAEVNPKNTISNKNSNENSNKNSNKNIDTENFKIGNIFVADTNIKNNKLSIITSQTGYQEVDYKTGNKYIVLKNGLRYEVEPGLLNFKITEFKLYKLVTQDGYAQKTSFNSNRQTLTELFANYETNASKAEILWRFSIPISAIILVLLAIPLSYVNPRATKSTNIIVAILLYAIYNNSISVAQAWVSQGKLSFYIATISIHLLMIIPLIYLLKKQISLR